MFITDLDIGYDPAKVSPQEKHPSHSFWHKISPSTVDQKPAEYYNLLMSDLSEAPTVFRLGVAQCPLVADSVG